MMSLAAGAGGAGDAGGMEGMALKQGATEDVLERGQSGEELWDALASTTGSQK
jgi:hypothetical protein